ncbi:hypothetical protein CSUI_007096 [Cystoisospora suis]|uniref:Uncharacterized protein n=1 Tax=Cystoisospora suis TaxID=483139 RepID=A0A2C6KRK5_9APIC|nr:hypothetical protein CSUI_007096 [Cystoisospora suis]
MGCVSSSAASRDASLWASKSRETLRCVTPVTSVESPSSPFGSSSPTQNHKEDEGSGVQDRALLRQFRSLEGAEAIQNAAEKKGCLSRRAHPTKDSDDHFPGNRPSAARRIQSVEWSLRFAPGVKSPDQDEDDIARRAAMGFARKRSNSVMQWTVAAEDDEAELNDRKEEHGGTGSQQDEKPRE